MLRRGPVINRNPINPKIWGICPAIKHRDTAEMKVLFGTRNAVMKITIGGANIPVAPPNHSGAEPNDCTVAGYLTAAGFPSPQPSSSGRGSKNRALAQQRNRLTDTRIGGSLARMT
jgi:hypothetical protein